jgi:hypothetical protein
MMAIPEIPDSEVLYQCIEDFERIASEYRTDDVMPAIQRIVPNYRNLLSENETGSIVINLSAL